MLFNSYIFIFLFLPFTLFLWYFLNNKQAYKMADFFLVIMSLLFYGYFNPYYLFIIIFSIFVNYLLSFIVERAKEKWQVKICMISGIAVNLLILFYFKYFDFFIENINGIFHINFKLLNILLPLGISFFTFQQLSFIIDRCRGRAPHYSLLSYMMFVTFFPQLVAGPIVLHDELIPQFENKSGRRFQRENFEKGIVLFVLGLSKKVLLADVLALAVNFGYEQVLFLDTPSALLVVLAYSLELYLDFSGYSDMAMGLGKMFNIELPANFLSPYKAHSFRELWRRWHITLNRFLITYIYIPLGGSKKGAVRTVINIMIVFCASGLWHGASWTFVIWGIIQGIFVSFDSLNLVGVKGEGKKNPLIGIPKKLGQVITFCLFSLSLVFFRAEDMPGALQMFKNIFAFKKTGYFPKLAARYDVPEFYLIKQVLQFINPDWIPYLYTAVFFLSLLLCLFILTRKNSVDIVKTIPLTTGFSILLSILFVWSVLSFSQVSTFIYFNF